VNVRDSGVENGVYLLLETPVSLFVIFKNLYESSWGYGGTGRRSGLKIRRRKACRFESDYPYQAKVPKWLTCPRQTTLRYTDLFGCREVNVADANPCEIHHSRSPDEL
jgi:hypothetical protein